MINLRSRLARIAAIPLFALTGCMVGPAYHQPAALHQPPPDSYKESPTQFADKSSWKVAQPQDAMLRGKWWKIFHDDELNALEDQLNVNNQNIKEYFQNYMAARALIAQARSQLFPTLTTSPSAARGRTPYSLSSASAAAHGGGTGVTANDFSLPLDVSWELDLWGKVRYAIHEAQYNSQVSAAELANEQLAEQTSLAEFFFEIRGQDALQKLYNDTIVQDKKQLDYTRAQYETGVGDEISVAEAQTTLLSAQAVATSIGIARAQYEHAIGVLVGKNPSRFTIPVKPVITVPPPVPIGVPSQLLERRPDIAAAERVMAAANAQIGIGYTAYYPDLTLSAGGGFESSSIKNLLEWPSRFWSIGATVSYTIYDAGLRRATLDQYIAEYNSDLFSYRQTVLTAFQQVEDYLAGVRLLSQQQVQQREAVQSANKSVQLELARYETGIDPYIDVVTLETTLLGNQQTLVTVQVQEITSTVQLIAALGGGWDKSQLPTPAQASTQPSIEDRSIQH